MDENESLRVTPCNKIQANVPIMQCLIFFMISSNFFQLLLYLIFRRQNGFIFGGIMGAIIGFGYYILENKANPGLIQQYLEYMKTPSQLSGNDSRE